MVKSYSTANVRQENWENRQGYSCHKSKSQREDINWAWKELKSELDVITKEYPNAGYDKLYNKLYEYAYVHEYDERLEDDLDVVVDEIVSEEVDFHV